MTLISALSFGISLWASTTLAQPLPSSSPAKTVIADPMPRCVRPRDFSDSRLVASYEACALRQQKYCDDHDRSVDCARLKASQVHVRYAKQEDADPSQRCVVERDGSYKCIQDPIRFTGGNEEPIQAPTTLTIPTDEDGTGAAPGASPAAPGTPTTPAAPGATGAPASGDPAAPLPIVMPKPPPKPN